MRRITLNLRRRGKAKTILSWSSLSGLLLLAAILAVFSIYPRPSEAQPGQEPECRTDEVHRRQLADPVYRRRRDEVERLTRNYLGASAKGDFGALTEPVIIPVVVHVVYNTAAQNISNAQIHSQIDVLNEDFGRLNSDAGLVPAEFSAVAADTRIQFKLAARAPDCSTPTDGITRTYTPVQFFSHNDGDKIKFTSKGGHDAWPTDKYLNIWVGPLVNGLGGYAQFPGGAAATDGVVMNCLTFGRVGTLPITDHKLGRIATHEVGHWLGLFHTFRGYGVGNIEYYGCYGTSAADCATKGDQVCDTPPTAQFNTGNPGIQNTCIGETPTDHNDQTMNYMDYTYDASRYLFTVGQAQRMEATLFTVRAGLLGSDALVPPPSVAGADLWMQDTTNDTGAEKNTTGDPMWISNDIWVRKTNDGFAHQDHQNPAYDASGASNFVYVRVRNRGCQAAADTTVRVYWAKASTALSWPSPWDGSISSPLMGHPIDVKQTGVVQGGDFVILEFEWKNVPNPADYASFGADKSHFCLLARIGDDSDMTYPETTDLYSNVMNNNNIVQKNVTILASDSGGGLETAVTVGNLQREPVIAALVFAPNKGPAAPAILRWGAVTVDLGADLFAKWQRGGAQGSGVRVVGRNTIQVMAANAQIFNVRLEPRELHTVKVRFKPYEPLPQGVAVYDFTLEQHHLRGRAYRIVGGEKFVVKTDYRR